MFVYMLIDPRTSEIRYVGWTQRPLEVRLSAHIREAKGGTDTYKNRWVRRLLAEGQAPVIWPIETTDDPKAREIVWIAHYRLAGCRLTNRTEGGDGALGRRHSAETRARMSVLGKLRPPITAETRAKISAAGRGRLKSDEHRRRISDAHKGKPKPWAKSKKPPKVIRGPLRGEEAPSAKLTWALVREMRATADQMTYSEMATKYGVRKCQIVNVLRNKDWKDPDYIPAAPRSIPSGEQAPSAKMTWAKVRQLREEPMPQSLGQLANKYEVSKSLICLILQGRLWKK